MKEPRSRPEVERRIRPRETAPLPERLWRARAAWQAAPSMDDRTLRQWWDNVRLRWDCHSTAIEGSSLSYRETVDLLVHHRLPADPPALWEIEQMRGHDDSAYQLAYWLNTGRVIGLEDLHAIHGMMLGRPYPARGIEGDRLARFVRVGQFKTVPNTLVADGQLVEFAPPEQVPGLMRAWWDRLTQRIDILAHDPQALDPAWVLASSHWDFIAIHPYDDGNGRMARWITNWMAMAAGYPPLVVSLERREEYFACYQGQAARTVPGAPDQVRPLRDFLAARLLEAVDFGIAVAEGRTDPSYANANADLDRPVPTSTAYTLETTVPRIRPRDRRDAPDGTAFGDSRWAD